MAGSAGEDGELAANGQAGWRQALAPWVVALVATTAFAYHLDREKFFADESAYIAHSYYYRLLTSGQWNSPDWLHPAAYDSPPLFKYLIGFALHRAGYATPTSLRPAEQWYAGHFDPPADPGMLRAARIPMLLGAVLGCGMMFLLGRTLFGPATGFLAALFLGLSPLYYTHARRAMGDDLAQGLVLLGLWGFVQLATPRDDQPWWLKVWRFLLAAVLSGVGNGLAASTKLNGAVGAVVVAAFAVLLCLAEAFRPGRPADKLRRIGAFLFGAALSGAIAVGLFVALNPYFYAHPDLSTLETASGNTIVVAGQKYPAAYAAELTRLANMGVLERVQAMARYRTEALHESVNSFPNDALPTYAGRLWALVLEGWGRWSAAAWLGKAAGPIVAGALILLGLYHAWRGGWESLAKARPPRLWLLLVWPLLETLLLLPNLWLNWDRYYLGTVTWSSLLMALAITGTMQRITSRLVLPPPNDAPESRA